MMYSQNDATITTVSFRNTFLTPEGNPGPAGSEPTFHLRGDAHRGHFKSIKSCNTCPFVFLCLWLPSLSITFQRPSSLYRTYTSTSFLSWLKTVPLYGYATFCFSTHRGWTFKLSPLWGYLSNAATNIHVQVFPWIYDSILLGAYN